MISIIIPVHNNETTILRAIESVAKQKVNKELIVIDDFCTDDTMKIVEDFDYNFDVTFSKTRFYRPNQKKPTGAPNIPRNIGVFLAHGKYIAFLDADDWWESTKLSEQLAAIKKHKADICTTSFLAHNSVSKTVRLHGKDTSEAVVVPDMFNRFLQRDKSKQTLMSSMLFKKSIYPKMDEVFGLTDYLWTARLLESHNLVVIEKPLTHRSVDNFNASYNSVIRELQTYEQLMTMTYYSCKNNLDLEKAKKGTYSSFARYCYMRSDYKKARMNFKHSSKGAKEVGYYLTSFVSPIAKIVSKKFNVWGDN